MYVLCVYVRLCVSIWSIQHLKIFPPLLGVSKSFPERLVLELQLPVYFFGVISDVERCQCPNDFIWFHMPGPKTCSHVISFYHMFITFSRFCDFQNCILWCLACRIRSSAVELPAPPPPMLYKPLFQPLGVTVSRRSETLQAQFRSTLLFLFSISATRKEYKEPDYKN